jgi:hypothetical protein
VVWNCVTVQRCVAENVFPHRAIVAKVNRLINDVTPYSVTKNEVNQRLTKKVHVKNFINDYSRFFEAARHHAAFIVKLLEFIAVILTVEINIG